MFVVTRMKIYRGYKLTYGVHHSAFFDCYILSGFGGFLLLWGLVVEVVLFERPAATGKAHSVGEWMGLLMIQMRRC